MICQFMNNYTKLLFHASVSLESKSKRFYRIELNVVFLLSEQKEFFFLSLAVTDPFLNRKTYYLIL